MNILHLSAVKNWGGGGNHIENLCYEISQSNPEIKNIIVIAENGQFHNRLLKSNFHYSTLSLSSKMDPRAIFKIIKLCKKEKIDIVHIHGSTSLALAVIAHNFSKLPPFIFSKKTSFPIKNRKRTLYKYNHPNIKKILCVSEATKTISAAMIKDPSKLRTVYHGTRMDNKSARTPFLLREKFNIPAEKIIIGNIANHTWPKNLKTFIDTANYLLNTKKQTQFHFIQMGAFSNLTPELTKKVETRNLEKHISFLDFVPNASNFIPQFDLTLITSESEGIPQVIYESFYHKTPVISTNVGGIPEIIAHNENGLLAEPFDYKALAQHILFLAEDKELQEKFTRRSKEKLQNFTTKIMAQKTLDEYKKILNGRS